MATSTIIKFLTAAVCIHLCMSVEMEFLYGSNEDYNKLCVSNDTNSWFPMPDSKCDARSFIVCFGRLAFVIDVCRKGYRFNRETGWCEPESGVPLPPGCKEDDTQPKVPRFCRDIGEGKIPHPNTCKLYIYCYSAEYNQSAPCPAPSFYIYGPGFNLCMYDMEYFRDFIPPDQLADCRKKDPYTAADFTTTTKRISTKNNN